MTSCFPMVSRDLTQVLILTRQTFYWLSYLQPDFLRVFVLFLLYFVCGREVGIWVYNRCVCGLSCVPVPPHAYEDPRTALPLTLTLTHLALTGLPPCLGQGSFVILLLYDILAGHASIRDLLPSLHLVTRALGFYSSIFGVLSALHTTKGEI